MEGNQEFDAAAAELDVPFKRTGKLIAGFTDEDRQLLENFKARGEANGVKGLEIIDRKRMDELDPSAGGNFAMWCPASGILDPFLYTIALAENAVRNGVEYHLNCAFTGETKQADGTHLLHTTRGDFLTRWVVNSAGLSSAEVSTQLGIPGYVIKPVKGEYFVLDKLAGQFARIPVYPAPNRDNTFDTHATPTVDGNVFAGPTAVNVNDKEDTSVDANLSEELATLALEATPTLNLRNTIRAFAGLRAQPSTGDFIITSSEKDARMIHAAGICSPGLTSAPAIAEQVEEELRITGLVMDEKAQFNPYRKHIPVFRTMTEAERRRAIAENPLYGRVICRCENVTEAEIVEAVRRGARTVDGVKRRTRAGMGRCQGGFCTPRVMEIIAREAEIPEEKITKAGGNSYMVAGKTRGEV